MITQKITCDKTGKELKGQGQTNMTLLSIQYKMVDDFPVIDEETGKEVKKKFVKKVENYQFHVCHDHADELMQHIKKFFNKD